MKTTHIAVLLAMVAPGVDAKQAFAVGPSESESQTIRRIQKEMEDKTLPEPPMWTLIHMAAEKEKEEALEAFCSEKPDDNTPWDLAVVIQKGGGLHNYRKRIAGLLKSRDATVRGFAVVWLADLGDRTYAKGILALLESDNLPDAGGFNKNWDRGQAAFALGVLGAQENIKAVATFLNHADRHLRAGAARGLGQMKAKAYEKEIAALLRDPDDGVVCAAIMALAQLDARQYNDRIVALAERTGPGIPETALIALVMLDAKEEAPRIAK